jgi:hypothetical protein
MFELLKVRPSLGQGNRALETMILLSKFETERGTRKVRKYPSNLDFSGRI